MSNFVKNAISIKTPIYPLQWFALSTGMVWVLMGLASTIIIGGFLGAALTIGGMGWLLATLLMDPQARRDLFGTRFEG